eukprot:2413543-Pyramimonas_sp.AAC.1
MGRGLHLAGTRREKRRRGGGEASKGGGYEFALKRTRRARTCKPSARPTPRTGPNGQIKKPHTTSRERQRKRTKDEKSGSGKHTHSRQAPCAARAVSYTHLRAHETGAYL